MKRYYLHEILFCYILITIMNCCTFTPSKLEEALVLSGENRCELEKVLKHYSACDDSLKLKAAEFLIENMPGHYTLRGKTIDHYREIIDKDSISSYYYKKILDISLSHFVSSGEDSQIQEDLRYITSDFLIRHIDLSFELLYKYSWLDMIAFDEFLEYVLPYRFENERLDLWRDSLHVYASNMPSEKVGDYFTNSLSGLIAKFKLKESTQMNLQIRRTLLDINSLGDCYLNAQNNLFEQRSLGIPAMIDYIPCYANRNGYHYWCNEPSVLFNKNHLELVFDRKPGKIYRKTFLKNKIIKPKGDEYIPEFFCDPFKKDVTDLYCPTVDLEVEANKMIRDSPVHVYLSVFNNLSWKSIAIGEVKNENACFPKMTRNAVYLPIYYRTKDNIQAYNYPFILNFKGEKEYLIPDTGKIQKIRLFRKNPQNYNSVVFYFKRLKKCFVKGSSTQAFNDADTVFQFAQTPLQEIISVNNLKDKTYQWYKIYSPEQSHIAEIYFYDENGNLLQAKVDEQYSMLLDDDPLTFTVLNEFNPLVINFGHPVKLSKLVCLPRSDGNGIYPDNTYELFYFDLDGWKSLGMKMSNDFYLEYDNVSSNALYWLRNWTTGVEERIFTYQNGVQKFW